ncbi:hypothetical protein XENTR_v10017411 [Xenopus tropicalis]|nr:hypothetical protein XENTR_v10017411 [Xenopus tropicalis]
MSRNEYCPNPPRGSRFPTIPLQTAQAESEPPAALRAGEGTIPNIRVSASTELHNGTGADTEQGTDWHRMLGTAPCPPHVCLSVCPNKSLVMQSHLLPLLVLSLG